MEYTKGVWLVTSSAFSRFSTFRQKRTGARTFVTFGLQFDEIAEVQGNTEEEAEANAYLIAAAPDMYEALKAVNKSEVGWGDKVKQALNKAEGVEK